ncbi:MAG: SocA family protein [Deltaproteobacteria bacterium]|uniref:SocA family protein n=1 Tax=Candidatus Zymogenus saltonus TaxID=2844893 RepID=A0A9D8PPB3_9DELT|nr:SocA family protein [Candidatus Zymogenus saltonus]
MEIIDKRKEKRINAFLYFCRHTNERVLFQTKMYKLLFFLDFMNFKEVGKPVTDLEYYAWDKGPVPKKLYNEINKGTAPKEILLSIIPIKDDETGERIGIKCKTNIKPNLKVFSRRELKLLEDLAYIFKDAKSEEIVEITHLKNEPWNKTKRTLGMYKLIDYTLALDNDAKIDRETALEKYKRLLETEAFFGVRDKNP